MHAQLNAAQQQGDEAAFLAQAHLQSSDLVLVASDNTSFPAHRTALMANSVAFAKFLTSAPAVAGEKTRIHLPFTRSEIALVLPYLYNTPMRPIPSLTFDGVWRAIEFAVTFKINRFISAISNTAGHYSNIPSLDHALLALFVASAIKDHGLLNWCFKKVMHLNPTPKILALTISGLIQSGRLMNTPLINTTTITLMAAAHRHHLNRITSHRTIHQMLKAHQHAHHSLPGKIQCTCTSAAQIEKLWQYAFQAKQHKLKKLVMAFEGKSQCEKGTRKALLTFYLHAEKMTEVLTTAM